VTASRPDRRADLELAVRAARQAGRAVMDTFRTRPAVRFKSPEQPVTEADLRADRILHRVLLESRPGYGWLSEETADSPERLARDRLWVCDPVDGTSSFMKGIAEFAVSIALVERGRPVLGVVHNPATGELFHAVAGGGAFRGGEPVRVSDTPPDAAVRTLLGSRRELARGDFESFRGGWRVEPLGSTAYKMAKVADGTADGFVSQGPKNEWDVAGAAVILAEAGGRATGRDGAELRYNRPHPSWHGVAATNGRLHDLVLSIIRAGAGGPGPGQPGD
jgi:myo-inositol-1(or 4)-monophosphatase